MKFTIFRFLNFCASVDIRPLPDARVAELLGVVLGVQDHKNITFPLRVYSSLEAKGLRLIFLLVQVGLKRKPSTRWFERQATTKASRTISVRTLN